MKKSVLSAVLATALAVTTVSDARAGAATAPSGGSDGVAILVILAIGAMIFGGNNGRSRTTKTTKPASSDF